MRLQSRRICLFVDNFSGHNIAYEPTNIHLKWFEPNLTSHIQPLDAGIIRCFKAQYRRMFCHRALELDDAGEANIYKVSLFEAMTMAKKGWDNVTSTTIKACWDHAGIQQAPIKIHIPTLSKTPNSKDEQAWSIIHDFATTDMTLPDAETALKNMWGDDYAENRWQPALKAVMDAENDVSAALSTIKKIQLTFASDLSPVATKTPQAQQIEQDLMQSVMELKKRNRVHGTLLTLEELVNPLDEKEIGEDSLGHNDDEIVDQINREKEGGTASDNESDSDADKEKEPPLGRQAAIHLCQQLESYCLEEGGEHVLELLYNLRRFRAQLRREDMQSAKQMTLEDLWSK